MQLCAADAVGWQTGQDPMTLYNQGTEALMSGRLKLAVKLSVHAAAASELCRCSCTVYLLLHVDSILSVY